MSSPALLDGNFILDDNVQIQPIISFHQTVLNRLDWNEDDYVVSIKNSRMQSKCINQEAVSFLEYFRTPCSIIQAVILHARVQKLEAQEVLTNVYAFVTSCIQTGILVVVGSKAMEKSPKFSNGSSYMGYKICHCVQFLTDTQLYEVEDINGEKWALKYIANRQSPQVVEALKREANSLMHLKEAGCNFVPEIAAATINETEGFIIMRWCPGKTLFTLLQETALATEDKFNLIINFITAYRSLNHGGILHGDVHPNNIIVDGSLQVRLVDFGLSARVDAYDTAARKGCVGSISYYAPEIASAEIEGNNAVMLTTYSEQYNIAVILYLVVAGNMYLPLSLEKETALRQICMDAPTQFSKFSIKWPAMEKVLFRALKKDPSERYSTLPEFYQAVENAVTEARHTKLNIHDPEAQKGQVETSTYDFTNAVQQFISAFGLKSSRINHSLEVGPTASLFHGATGIAYTFLRMASLFHDPSLLRTAEVWMEKAKAGQFDSRAFENKELGLVLDNINPCSLFHSKLGIYVVDALIQYACCYSDGATKAVNDFINLAETYYTKHIDQYGGDLSDLSQGHGGVLVGAAQLLKSKVIKDPTQHEKLIAIVQKYVAQLVLNMRTYWLSKKVAQKRYLGFAHGYAGSLYAVIEASKIAQLPTPGTIEKFLTVSESFCIRKGNTLKWPIYSGQVEPVWTGWCHGSAGQLLVWLCAANALKKDSYLENAIGLGEHIWQHYGNSGVSLCCGMAGESLALLQLANATADKKWQSRGLKLANHAIRGSKNFEQPNSLFRGSVGLSYLSAEALFPSSACWPIFDTPL